MKRGGPGHPKTAALAALLQIDGYAAVGILECLFHWSAVYARQGDIGRHPDAAIASGIGWKGDAGQLVGALTESGWLDRCCDRHRLRIHDWPTHADQSVQRTKDIIEQGFIKCYKTRNLPAVSRKNASEKLDAAGTGTGTGNRLPAQVTGTGGVRESAEFLRLKSEPEVAALAARWVAALGGKVGLGLLKACHRFFASGYEETVAFDAISGIASARQHPDWFPEKCTARWSAEHNDKPEWVLRPEKVEAIAADYVKHGRHPKATGNPAGGEESPRAAAERRAREQAEIDQAAAIFTPKVAS